VEEKIKYYKPGIPTDPATTMGAIVSKQQFDRVMSFIDSAKSEGAQLVCGGGPPPDPPRKNGFLLLPTQVPRTAKKPIAPGGKFGSGGRKSAVRCWACSNGTTRQRCLRPSTRWNTASPLQSGPMTLMPRTAPPWR